MEEIYLFSKVSRPAVWHTQPSTSIQSFCLNILISLHMTFAADAHIANGQVYDQHETKQNFWVSVLANDDQQRPKGTTIY
jgi:hypothetical protein